jgi:hypothetical protein
VTARPIVAAVVALGLAAGSVLAWQDDGRRRDPPRPAGDTATADGTALDGATLFAAKGCAWCHDSARGPAVIGGAPDLTDVATWGGDRRPGLDAAAYIVESVREPTAVISPAWRSNGGPNSGMPSLAVSDPELDAIVAFLLE